MKGTPHLSFSGGPAAEAVVLLLHGGMADGFASVRPLDPAVLRLLPFGRSVVRASGGRIALAKLRYTVRGWNGDLASPLADARWALDQIDARFGHLPLGLVGHSMGGRVALRVADYRSQPDSIPGGDARILEGNAGAPEGTGSGDGRGNGSADRRRGLTSIAALAPWLPDGEPPPALGDRVLLLAHGTADRTTDPVRTAELAEKLRAAGRDVELVEFPNGRHSMLFPARPWHDLVARFMVRTLLTSPARQI
jgi:pimeloyl-ACP methyl ester carboxylesterase